MTRFNDQFSERQLENRRRAVRAYKKRLYYGDSARSIEWRKQTLVSNAKVRAKKVGMEFSITVEALHWPEVCPVLGFRLNYGAPTDGHDSWDGPSIDRHDNTKGYTLENSVVMSRKANALKSNADVNEVEKLLSYMRKRFII